jgi:hypothetical protein
MPAEAEAVTDNSKIGRTNVMHPVSMSEVLFTDDTG